jgi:hypothetical protein
VVEGQIAAAGKAEFPPNVAKRGQCRRSSGGGRGSSQKYARPAGKRFQRRAQRRIKYRHLNAPFTNPATISCSTFLAQIARV